MFLAFLRIEPEELLQISEAIDEAFYQLAHQEAIKKFVSDPNTFNIFIEIRGRYWGAREGPMSEYWGAREGPMSIISIIYEWFL